MDLFCFLRKVSIQYKNIFLDIYLILCPYLLYVIFFGSKEHTYACIQTHVFTYKHTQTDTAHTFSAYSHMHITAHALMHITLWASQN